jgi:hypothetical protein
LHNLKYSLIIIIAGFLLSSCEKKDNSIIDPVLNFPVIDSASVTPTVFDTSNVHMSVFAHVVSSVPITNVTAKVFNPLGNQVANVILVDSGNDRYAGSASFAMDCRIVGQYSVKIVALNNQNLFSNEYPVSFRVINSHNHNPIVANFVITPNDFIVNTPACIVFWVRVSDPDGLCDIKDVHYFGTQPDDSLLTQHRLYDDGSCCLVENTTHTSGDTTANDGNYTRLLCGSPNKLGYYKYHIIATDRSDSTSNILTDSIFVHQ